jgi:hypothetical protein
MIAMLRETWWWPWWISSLIDLGVVAGALVLFRINRRRLLRTFAGAMIVGGLVAAGLAPVVMNEPPETGMRNQPMMPAEP